MGCLDIPIESMAANIPGLSTSYTATIRPCAVQTKIGPLKKARQVPSSRARVTGLE